MKSNSTDEEERNEVKNTIQQTVSHFTSNTNKVRSFIRKWFRQILIGNFTSNTNKVSVSP